MTTRKGALAVLLEEIESLAIEMAAEGGRMAAERFRLPQTVEYKGPDRRSPVTEADRLIEDFLRNRIAERFPSHRVLGEERPDLGPPDADYVWVLDPIDGTANFVSGLPVFAVSIGVLCRGEPVVGALYLASGPRTCQEILHARKGAGCYVGGERLKVVDDENIVPRYPAALAPTVRGTAVSGVALRAHPPEGRALGSIASELALTAAGCLQFAFYLAPRIWDVAGGLVLVTEAGGNALQWDETKRAWSPLDRFVAIPHRHGDAQLRDWSRPVMAGGPAAVKWIAANVRVRGDRDARLRRWIWERLTQ